MEIPREIAIPPPGSWRPTGGFDMTRLLRTIVVIIFTALVATSWSISAGCRRSEARNGDREDIVETFLRMRVLAAVLETEAWEARPFPGPTGGLVSVSWLRDRLERDHRDELRSGRDAWGGSLLYWSNGREYAILSFGRDGFRQFDYDGNVPYQNVPRSYAVADPADDLLIVNGMAWRGPASQMELLRHAMADVRSLGTSVESFAVDTNAYPGPVAPIAAIEVIAGDIEPIYIRVAPRLDPWGSPYLFWSDTRHYAIVTLGSDGSADEEYETWGLEQFTGLEPEATVEPGKDIVFVDGQFVRWPAALQ
jgi:hypothetical protein